MKNIKNKKQIALINFYKLNDQGQIVYAYGDEAGMVVSLNEGTMYEFTKSELANFTDRIFAKNVWSDARQYNLYYADRTTRLLVEMVRSLLQVLLMYLKKELKHLRVMMLRNGVRASTLHFNKKSKLLEN